MEKLENLKWKNRKIKDLFIKNKSFIVESEINKNYYLFIENLDEFDGTQTANYSKRLLTENILVEIIERGNDQENEAIGNISAVNDININTSLSDLFKISTQVIDFLEKINLIKSSITLMKGDPSLIITYDKNFRREAFSFLSNLGLWELPEIDILATVILQGHPITIHNQLNDDVMTENNEYVFINDLEKEEE